MPSANGEKGYVDSRFIYERCSLFEYIIGHTPSLSMPQHNTIMF